jgi:hypothetical protein
MGGHFMEVLLQTGAILCSMGPSPLPHVYLSLGGCTTFRVIYSITQWTGVFSPMFFTRQNIGFPYRAPSIYRKPVSFISALNPGLEQTVIFLRRIPVLSVPPDAEFCRTTGSSTGVPARDLKMTVHCLLSPRSFSVRN